MLHKIIPGTNPANKNEAVFIAVTTEADIYRDYEEISYDKRQTIVPLMIFLNRFDGTLGFIGGNKDGDETLVDCAVREMHEETGFKLSEEQKSSLELVCSHEIKNKVLHLFSLQVSEQTFKSILSSQTQAQHYLAEGTLFATHCINYSHAKAFDNFMKHNFAYTVKDEIQELLMLLGWDKKYELLQPKNSGKNSLKF
jgi:8-oxo-dGTP pyrophosphatase MutT (NUDIX family)